jgi:SAM-dependent methyltransferase
MSDARFDSTQAQEYWRVHYGRRAPVNLDNDADGLNNVCHPGRPLWLNRYYARFQDVVFRKLLAAVPRGQPPSAPRALDVGCGAGRWCRLLEAAGYDVTGVDLQSDLLARNRERMPGVRFVTGSMQDFSSSDTFDLVTTVTVLQHNPPEEQDRMIANMRRLLRPGGCALALENVSDQDVHVFANSVDGWTRRFERAGFRRLDLQRYDFSPLLRADRFVALGARRLAGLAGLGRAQRAASMEPPRDPGAPVPAARSPMRRAFVAAHEALLHVCVTGDSLVENVLIEANAPLPTVHCGFLFQVA